MITLFSTPKDFIGEFNIIQKNALRSWVQLEPKIQIILLGNSKGVREAAEEMGSEYVRNIRCSKSGTPILSDIFKEAEKRAIYPIMTFINADIILPANFLDIINLVVNRFNRFLVVGHRWDMDVRDIINFDKKNEINKFWHAVKTESTKHPCTGIDYFIYKKGQYKDIPDFFIGRWGWDNWLLWQTRRKRLPLIDASDEIQVIHQNHSYKFHHVKSLEDSRKGHEFENNMKLLQNKSLNILDAIYKIEKGQIISKGSKSDKMRYWHKLPIIFPELSLPIKILRRYIINKFVSFSNKNENII